MPSRANVLRGLGVLAVLCAGVLVTKAQEVGLQVRTKDGRTAYRIGEPITLELVFTSSSKEYIVDTSTRYPEVVRPSDEIRVELREGWEDPFADYRKALSSSQRFFDVGGLRGLARTGDKPVIVEVRLNRFVRFTKAGRYVLNVRSGRVRRSANGGGEITELNASQLELTIMAVQNDWPSQQLEAALEVLRKGPGTDVRACETVESLSTEASEIAMALAMESEKFAMGCNFSTALIGAGHRQAVLERMQSELKSPAASVSPGFVGSMATLMALEERADGEFWQAQNEALAKINETIWEHLKEKKGKAKVAAISTLVNETLNGYGSESAAGVSQSEILHIAAENFEQLSSQAQATLLSAKWKEVASPAMVSVLRRCAEAENGSVCGDMQAETLLVRLNELSPKDAREVILAEIGKANPRPWSSRALGMLPEKELPEFDGVLLGHLQSNEANVDMAAALIARYASEGIAGPVASFLDKSDPSQFGGEIQQNLIAYLYRVQPELAEQRLRRAMAAREGTGWYKYTLAQIAQKNPQAKLQDIAIEALRDEDRDVVQSAVQAVELTGDTRGKAALFERLEQWQQSWMGRKQEISYEFFDGPVNDDRFLGDALIQAIGRGSGWLLSEQDQQLLIGLALTENQKQTAEQTVEAARRRPVTFWVNSAGDTNFQIMVGQYSYERLELAERKILQYPRGTAFLRQNVAPDGGDAARATASLEEFLTANGMKLEKQTAAN